MVKAVTGLRARVRTRGGTRMSRAKTPSAMAQKGHGRDLTAAPRPRSARPIIGGAGPRGEALALTYGGRRGPARGAYALRLASTPATIVLLTWRLAPWRRAR